MRGQCLAENKAQPLMPRVLEFHEFCDRVLGLHLTTGQRVIAKVAFGHHEPADLDGGERELAITMFGGLDRVPASARRTVVLRLGRGSGKTSLCAAYAAYTAVTQDVSKCGPGDVPVVIVIAPDKATAQLAVRMAREMIRGNKALETLVVGDDTTSIRIRRPDGRLVAIEAFAANRGGASVRGRSILAFILDEAEFFQSDKDGGAYVVNDRDIFKALKPRLMPGGKGMMISTPWPSDTLMAELFDENFGHMVSAVAIEAPTLLVRGDDEDIQKLVAEEVTRDPDNAEREFFCKIDRAKGGTYFDGAALVGSVDKIGNYPLVHNSLWRTSVAVDFGFKQDSSTLVVVQYDGRYYRVAKMHEISPKSGHALKPSSVVAEFAKIAKAYGVSAVVSDGHYREAMREHLLAHGLHITPAPEGIKGKMESYARARTCLHEGLCRFPDSKRLIEQAKLITSKASQGGLVSIRSPRRTGLGHGDLVSAWVLAVNDLAYASLKKERIQHEPGSPEWATEFQRRVLLHEQKQMKDALRLDEKDVLSKMSRRRAVGFGFRN